MGQYLGAIGKPHNDECLINIFTRKFENGNLIIFNKKLYRFWYKESRDHFSPILINSTHKNVYFKSNLWVNSKEWCH